MCSGSTSIHRLIRLDYYFDLLSPYSWIGYEKLRRLMIDDRRWNNVIVNLRPINEPKLISKHAGLLLTQQPPTILKYIQHDVQLELSLISDYQLNSFNNLKHIIDNGSMHAQLFLGLIKDEQCDYFDRAFEHLWQRLWLHGKAIHRGVCRLIGIERIIADDIVSRLQTIEAIRRIANNTDDALWHGVGAVSEAFQSPWITIDMDDDCRTHSFAGIHRFDIISNMLNEKNC